MEVTGWAIMTDKVWWYLMDYVWKRGTWVGTDACSDLNLVATDSDEQEVSLRRLKYDNATEMLGVWLALNVK